MSVKPPKDKLSPNRFMTAALVAELVLRFWINSAFRGFGSAKKAMVLASVGVFFLLAYIVLGTIFLRAQLPLTAPESLTAVAPLLTFVLMTLSVFLTVLCFIYAPPASHIMVFLSVFALKYSHIQQALSWLALALGIAFTAIFTFPLIFNVTAAAPGTLTASFCLFYSLFMIALCALGTHVLLQAFVIVFLLFTRRSASITKGIAALLTAVPLIYLTFQAVPFGADHQPHGPAMLYGDILSAILDARTLQPYQWAALVLPLIPLLAGTLLLGQYQSRTDYLGIPSRRSFPLPLRFFPQRNIRRPAPLYLLEAKQWLRFPSNAVNTVFLVGLSCCFFLLHVLSENNESLLGVNVLMAMLFGTIGISFYGVTKPYHWLYRTFRAHTSSPWRNAKLCAAVLIWIVFNLLYIGPMIISGGISADSFFFLSPTLLLELLISLIIGFFFLASKEQAFGTTVSEGITALAIVFASIGIENMVLSLEKPAIILAAKWAILFCAVASYYCVAHIRNRQSCLNNQ